jgi:hypothetical protein
MLRQAFAGFAAANSMIFAGSTNWCEDGDAQSDPGAPR